MSRFPSFSVFSPYSRSYSVFFSICMFFSVSRHIPGHTFFASPFPRIHFSPHIQVIECSCLIFQDFQFPRHNPGTTVYIFHFLRYSPFFAINFRSLCVCFSFSMILNFHALLQVLQCAFLICHIFPCFLSPTRSNNVCVSFSMFFSFLAIFQDIHFSYLIFYVIQFSWIFQVLQCVFLNLHIFPCFLPNSRTYSVRFSYSTFFSSLAIFQVLECVFLIFHVFDCF